MERPSFTRENMEMKEKILVRDWMNWLERLRLVYSTMKQERTAEEFIQLMKFVLKNLPKNSQIYQQYKGIHNVFIWKGLHLDDPDVLEDANEINETK